MSPESARPRTAGASMPGLHWSLQPGAGPGVAVGERLDHPEHVLDAVGVGVAELADRLVQGAAQRAAQPLVGPGLQLAGAPAAAYGGGAQRVEQHRLAHAAQAGEHQRALRTALDHPLEHHVEGPQLLVAAGQLGRPLTGAGGVRVPDRVHDRTVSAGLANSLDLAGVVGVALEQRSRVLARGRDGVRRIEPAPEHVDQCPGPPRRSTGTSRCRRCRATARRRPGRRRGARDAECAVLAAGVEEDRPRHRQRSRESHAPFSPVSQAHPESSAGPCGHYDGLSTRLATGRTA